MNRFEWNEEKLRDRCQQIIVTDHAHTEAIGCVDESGTTKSGEHTVGVGRQYNGNRGKIDNCVVGVHLSYAAPGFQVLLDSRLYLPEDFANDPARRKNACARGNRVPHQTANCRGVDRPRCGQRRACLGLDLRRVVRSRRQVPRRAGIAWAGVRGRDSRRLPRLDPKPQSAAPRAENKGRGRPKDYPRLAVGYASSEVRTLASYSPVFRKQSWQRYRIKDTDKGPVVWEVKWAVFWRKDEDGLPTRRHCLIVARNVLTDEMKYFLSNRVPGEVNPVTGQPVTLR